ncbi:MAG: helix-turn-helix transcriptional regulator [Sciscionella sp.]
MTDDLGVDDIVRQWTLECSADAEVNEARRVATAWLQEAGQAAPSFAGVPGQRVAVGTVPGQGGSGTGFFEVSSADPAYLVALRHRLPGVPEEALRAAASCWQMVGSIADARAWWDAGVSPLDQRAMEYRAAGLSPADLSRHLGPYTVLQHLRKGSAPAWCVARLQRQRRDGLG